ncbi:hypothetical protein ADUPG1_007231 [Aduncisulcus paluster]|uniref:Chromo domain-containing protein n=1 Tax=Aduncisulcus paluster TaxID=2918883 RepID=A0ABQ5KQM1_9EUKA|nr:hypothetical protein ADUPG1_007231 [Aduncisulcus paluster]
MERQKSFAELPDSHKDVDEYVKDLTENIRLIQERAKVLQHHSYGDPEPEIEKGEWIIVKRFPPPKKLELAWIGPYQVIQKTGDREYYVRSPLGAERTVHSQDIKIVPGVSKTGALDAIATDLGLRLPREVLKKKGKGKGLKFLVRWYGLPDHKTTWMTKKDIQDSEAFQQFMKQL